MKLLLDSTFNQDLLLLKIPLDFRIADLLPSLWLTPKGPTTLLRLSDHSYHLVWSGFQHLAAVF